MWTWNVVQIKPNQHVVLSLSERDRQEVNLHAFNHSLSLSLSAQWVYVEVSCRGGTQPAQPLNVTVRPLVIYAVCKLFDRAHVTLDWMNEDPIARTNAELPFVQKILTFGSQAFCLEKKSM